MIQPALMGLVWTSLLLADPEPSAPPAPEPAAATEQSAPTEKQPRKLLRKRGEDAPAPGGETPKKEADEAPTPESDRPIPMPETKQPSELDDALDKNLGQDLEAAESEKGDPLADIAQEMQESEELLAQLADDQKSIELQDSILDQIEKLLEQARNSPPSSGSQSPKKRQQMSRQSSMAQRPSQSQQTDQQGSTTDPSERVGPPRQAREKLSPQPEDRNVWGHLSEMLRAEMGQYAKENFLAKYRDLIERYYIDIARQGEARGDR